MRIEKVNQNLTSADTKKTNSGKPSPGKRIDSDSVNISPEARSLNSGKNTEALSSSQNLINNRKAEKIQEVKAKLLSGAYNHPELKEKTAGKLLESEKFKHVIYDLISVRKSSFSHIRQEKIEQVKERLACGFYHTEEFSSQLADKLMEFLIRE